MDKNQPAPQGKYIPANRWGNLIYTAGMTPRKEGVLILAEKVSCGKPFEYYREAAVLAAGNALTAARAKLSEDESTVKILSMTVYIAAEEGFANHSKIADFASDHLCEELGECGLCSRVAIGVATLPGNAPVEIQLVAAAE